MRKYKQRRRNPQYHSSPNIHYHYHYHYQILPMQSFRYDTYFQDQSVFETYNDEFELNQQRKRSKGLSQCEWKRYLNPKVSRMYDAYQHGQSTYSQNIDRISQKDEEAQIQSPKKSDVIRSSLFSNKTTPQKTKIEKLDQLYNFQRTLKSRENFKDTFQITLLTNTSSIDPQNKLQLYQKQIERLQSIQQECIYLREKFHLHIQRRHPKAIK